MFLNVYSTTAPPEIAHVSIDSVKNYSIGTRQSSQLWKLKNYCCNRDSSVLNAECKKPGIEEYMLTYKPYDPIYLSLHNGQNKKNWMTQSKKILSTKLKKKNSCHKTSKKFGTLQKDKIEEYQEQRNKKKSRPKAQTYFQQKHRRKFPNL